MLADFQKPIRFASINIEHNLHYDRIFPFLKNFQPDVFCAQEIFECDIHMFEQELGMKCVFAPMAKRQIADDSPLAPLTLSGVAIFTRLSLVNSSIRYYVGSADAIPLFYKNPEVGTTVINKVLLSVELSCDDVLYTFATTHFTWTKNGEATDEQRVNLKELFSILDTMPDFVLSGDFNAPRGREIFTSIANRYRDNIPTHYRTSIDGNLHRAGDLQLMVDGLFSTPQYTISEVKLTEGVSDHQAVTAIISKK
ncbi:MAG: endonuclease/exonuclease/phosphatase family protein [Patescibacteria group bacterium]